MKPVVAIWLALTIGALLSGSSLVGLMVVRKSNEPVMWTAGFAGLVSSMWAFLQMPEAYGRADALLYALAFMLASFAGGYALASSGLYRLSQESPTENPSRSHQRAGLGSTEPVIDVPLVILFACAEPPVYEPRATARLLQELVDEGLLELSIGSTPIMFLAQKARYRAAGTGSPSRSQLRDVAERLRRVLGTVADVDTAVCSGEEALARSVAGAIADGYRKIVVAEFTAAESLHHAAAKRAVDSMRPADSGVSVTYTAPLWDSERIAAMLVARVTDLTDEPNATGAVLVGHGQPEERAHRNPALDENEAALLNRARMMLVESGLSEDHVRVAWAEWRAPDVTSAIRHLAALGCRRVIVVPACFPLDSLTTRLDLELSARQARVQEEVTVITTGGWRDHESVVEELRSRVQAALDE